jgi:eukaryotic-like serine/threonine-protein kinase
VTIPSGTKVGRYEIRSQIGEGGMGEVYLAQDTKLDRNVAIKFLNEEFSKDADRLNRFIQEAKAASALNHPNILTVYEIDKTEETNYIVTELIDGKTLRENLAQKETLQLNTILKIGAQVSEALAAAHQAGIIHRDIKPENIMLRKDGYAKVLDFGLAKLTEKKKKDDVSLESATRAFVNTTPGMVMGTVSYMSPEQARGKETDARTDIWSVGVVLYEMLAGTAPFTGETVNHTIVSILEKEPLLLENVPGELQRIVRKSLTKDVEMRYQSARDLLIDLKNLRRELDIRGELERSIVPNREATTSSSMQNQTQVYGSDPVKATISGQAAATHSITTSSSSLEYAVAQAKSHKLATAIIGILLVGVISTVGYSVFVTRGTSSKQINSIAVMPFENRSENAESEYLSDGLAETLIYRLSQLPNLKVSPASSVMRYKGKEFDAQKIAAELGVNAVMSGRLVQRGDNLTISVELIDVANNKTIWGEQYERKMSDLLVIKQEIAREITEKLRLKMSGEEQKKLAGGDSTSAEAYQLYLKGRYLWNKRNKDDLNKSIGYFNQAIEKDPGYALAYTGLADSWFTMGWFRWTVPKDAFERAKSAAMKALAIDSKLAEAHTTLAMIKALVEWDWQGADNEFKLAIASNPNYPTAHQRYSLHLATLGRLDEAVSEAKKAQELDPLSLIINENVGDMLYLARRYDEAETQLLKTIELDPNFGIAHTTLSKVYDLKGMYEKSFDEGFAMAQPEQAAKAKEIYVRSGIKGVWRSRLGRLLEDSKHEYVSPQNIAMLYARLGELDKAFEWLERGLEERSIQFTYLVADPRFDNLRADPRYAAIMRRVGLRQ